MPRDSSEEILSLETIIMKAELLALINGSNSLEELKQNLAAFRAKYQEAYDLFSQEDIKELDKAYILKKSELLSGRFIKALDLLKSLKELKQYYNKTVSPSIKKDRSEISKEDIRLIEKTYCEKKSELIAKNIIYKINFSENLSGLEKHYKKAVSPRPKSLLEKDLDSIKMAYQLKISELRAKSPTASLFNKKQSKRQPRYKQVSPDIETTEKSNNCCFF